MTTSRTRPSGLRGLILAGAGAISLLSSCNLDKNYWSSPRAADDMALLGLAGSLVAPYAHTLNQAAALGAISNALQHEATRMGVKENSERYNDSSVSVETTPEGWFINSSGQVYGVLADGFIVWDTDGDKKISGGEFFTQISNASRK